MPRPRIFGLMYHDVVADDGGSGRAGEGPDRYKLTWTEFRDHLTTIARAAPAPLRLGERAGATRQGWALTFDDGGSSSLAVAEELARSGWHAHFFVTTGLIGKPGFVDPDEIRELARLGHVVGSHSVTHPPLMSSLPEAELHREWRDSAAELADVLGAPVHSGSVPGGHYRRNVARAAARAGLDVLFTSEPVRDASVHAGCLVVGRYTVRRHTSGKDAAAAAAGAARPWLGQWAGWNLRKPAKMLAGRQYDRIRGTVLGQRSHASRTTDS